MTKIESLICTYFSDPMRITKKFAGSNGIGKQIFSPSPETEKTVEVRKALEREILELEERFLKRIDYSMASNPLSLGGTTTLGINGDFAPFSHYRVSFPSPTPQPPPFASNKDLIESVNVKRTTAAIDSADNTASYTQKISSLIKSQAVLNSHREVESPVYVDENYRVHGFQPVFVKKDAAKVEVQASFKEKIPFKPKPEIKLEGSAAFVKQPKLPKPPKEPKEPKAAKQLLSLKAKSDPIQDLQASALLLDFFRSAREKEVAEDSEEPVSWERPLETQDSLGAVVAPEPKKLRIA